MYIDGVLGKVKYYDATNYVKKELMAMVIEYKPDGIFSAYGFPGWFFIIGGKIVFIENRYCSELGKFKLLYHDNALEYVKLYFSDPLFIPVTTEQEIK